MGLIKKIFGGISAFFGSLFGVAGKLFGIGKSEYYLELEESKTDSLPETAKSVAKATAASAGAVVDAIASDSQEPARATAGGDPANRSAKHQSSKNGKQAQPSKDQKGGQKGQASQTEAEAKPQRPLSTEEIIAQAIARAPKSTYQDNSHVAEQTFATDYLVTPSSNQRRRPGPSLSSFKQMAKEVGKEA